MELKPGYKRTDVGVIPADWDVKGLQAVCSENITYGIVQCGPHSENGVPYIRVSDMNTPELDVSGMLRTSHSIAASFSRSRVNEGDVVYALRGKLGEVRRIDASVAGANLTQGTARLSPGKRVTGAYLLWSLRSQSALRQVELEAKGSTFREITLADLRGIEIAIPLIPEQEAIAEALSDADALIESLDQLITKKRDLKQGAMQELLTGKKRLPGSIGEWEVKRLGDLADMGSGGTPPSSNLAYYDGNIPWVAISDMTKGGKYIDSTERNLSVDGLASSAAQMFPVGTVLYAMYASLGECSIATVPLSSSQAILGIRAKQKLNGEFLYYFLQSIKPLVKTMGQQGTQANLNKRMVQDFSLHLPSHSEQSAIATILSDMDTELAKARHIKQGMMQELLTGRIRLL
jgi:type I restriction enzyme S subunit